MLLHFRHNAAHEALHQRAWHHSGAGLAAGAALMYLLDPEKGKRRRALIRDKIVHAGKLVSEAPRVLARDLAGRSSGIAARLVRPLRSSAATDRVLVERVRSRLGRVVSHPHAIDVEASGGHIVLRGPILAAEVERLIHRAQTVPGVSTVDNRLEVYEEAGRIPDLQGAGPIRPAAIPSHWSPTARLLSGGLAAGMMLFGARGRSPGHMALLLGSGALMLRAAGNRGLGSMVGIGPQSGIDVEKSIWVDAPVKEVFDFWADYQNFPRFMSRVREVRQIDETRSHWVVKGPAGTSAEWISEIRKIVPEQLIAWCTDGESTVQHSGAVRLRPEGKGTHVQVQLRYWPPAGDIGHALAVVFRADPRRDMHADLLRMKQAIESGRPPHAAA